MPLFNQMYYDQKWSVWDTWRAVGRNVRGYIITTQRRMGNLITSQKQRGNVITTQKHRGNVITGV